VTLTNVSASTLNTSIGITTGSLRATGTSSLANVTVTNISTGGLNATGTSSLANVTVIGSGGVGTNGALLISGADSFGHSLYIATASALGKRLTFQRTANEGAIFAYDYGGSVSQNLILQAPGGNVGIGIASPDAKLDVNGTILTRVPIDPSAAVHWALRTSTSTNRWTWCLGGTETGSNTGSDLKLINYHDSGDFKSIALVVNRSNNAFSIGGALSKGSGTFDIQHPLKNNPDERLVHSFIEGPRCDLIYRGTVQLVNGIATVNIDSDCVQESESAMAQGTFEALCANPVYYLQNHDSFDRVKASISGNILTITCENTSSTNLIHWMVIAERKDQFIKEWDRTNSNGYLVTEYTKN